MFITLSDSIRLNHIICSCTQGVDKEADPLIGTVLWMVKSCFIAKKTVKMFCAFFLWTLIVLAAFP